MAPIQIKILISCPSNMERFVQLIKGIIKEENINLEKHTGVSLKALYFKDIVSEYTPDSAQKYTLDTFNPYDIYYGFMSTEFGTPFKNYGSGTEYEYLTAIKSHKETGRPHYILFGFSEEKINPYKISLEEFKKVRKFKENMSQFQFNWKDDEEFIRLFRTQINDKIQNILKDSSIYIEGGSLL